MRIDADLQIQPSSDVSKQKQAKLVDAAQQFEATLLQELLKPIQHGQSSWGDEEKNDDPASDTMSSFGTECIAKAISKGGGLGIARSVVKEVNQERIGHLEKKPPGTKVCETKADLGM
jgi:peptidoglycan hydrolase FlgJ